MTTLQNVRGTYATMRSIQATFEILANKSSEEDAIKVFTELGKQVETMINEMYRQVKKLEREEEPSSASY